MESKTKADQQWIADGGYFDPDEPAKVKRFAETFGRLPDKPNETYRFIPWVWTDLVQPLYGTKNEDGTTRFKRGAIFVMKKQTKSSTIALLSLYDLCSTDGAEVYIWSSNYESCGSIWKYAAFIAENTPLKKHLKTNHNLKTIKFARKGGFIKLLSGSDKGKRGQNSTSVYVDEISDVHEHQLSQWEGLYNSGAARYDTWKMISLSTPQYDRRSLAWSQWSKAKAVLNNEDDDQTFLPIIHSVPEEHRDDPDKWWDFIPSLGTTTSKKVYLDTYNSVKDSPRDLAVFRAEMLCQWVTAADQWLPDTTIDQAAFEIDEKELYGKDAWIGVDAALYSLSAYSLLIPHNGKLVLLVRFQIPIETARKSDQRYGTKFMAWGKSGFLSLTDGNQFDPAFIRSQIIEDSKRFNLIDAASDGYNFAESATTLQTDHNITVHDLPPTIRALSEATVEFERRISKGELVYISNPVMSHCLRNVQVREFQDGIIIDRKASSGRYDGVSAGIVSLNRYLNKPAYRYTGIYTLDG